MGQLPADAPCKAAHSSRNRARRMKAARAEARRLVDEARDKRDSALAELSSVKAELAKTKQEHERKCEEFKHKCAEMAAAVEAAADNAAAADEIENLKRINAATLEFLDSERSKTQGLLERLGEANDQIESERSEKEEFRQEVLGLRSRLENTSGMSIDEVNGLVARAQEAENRASELAFDMSTLQNQAEDRERQLEEARESCWQLKAAADEQMKRLENHNAALHDSVAQTKAELETVSAERDELLGKLGDSSSRIEELESSLEVERQGASHLRDSEQSSADKIGDLARENEALGKVSPRPRRHEPMRPQPLRPCRRTASRSRRTFRRHGRRTTASAMTTIRKSESWCAVRSGYASRCRRHRASSKRTRRNTKSVSRSFRRRSIPSRKRSTVPSAIRTRMSWSVSRRRSSPSANEPTEPRARREP